MMGNGAIGSQENNNTQSNQHEAQVDYPYFPPVRGASPPPHSQSKESQLKLNCETNKIQKEDGKSNDKDFLGASKTGKNNISHDRTKKKKKKNTKTTEEEKTDGDKDSVVSLDQSECANQSQAASLMSIAWNKIRKKKEPEVQHNNGSEEEDDTKLGYKERLEKARAAFELQFPKEEEKFKPDINVKKLKILAKRSKAPKKIKRKKQRSKKKPTMKERLEGINGVCDLNRMNLKKLDPPTLREMITVRCLDLSHNQLQEIPPAIANVTLLRSLRLHNNNITVIPFAFFTLTGLGQLDISKNKLSELDERFSQLHSLQLLNASSNRLHSIEGLKKMQSLQTLNLEHNMLEDMHGEITSLQKLRFFDCSNNSLRFLPIFFGRGEKSTENTQNLTMLEELNLSRNQLERLPPGFPGLVKLKRLYLNENELKSLPQDFGDLESLEHLNLNKNMLGQLPESLCSLPNLKSLAVAENDLTYIPVGIGDIKSLEDIDLSDNQLNHLPESFGGLINLKEAWICRNGLCTISPSFFDARQLEILHLFGNNLEDIPMEIGLLSKLRYLSLHQNSLKSLPKSIIMLEDLERLLLHENEKMEIWDSGKDLLNFKSLTEISLDGRVLETLSASVMKWYDKVGSNSRFASNYEDQNHGVVAGMKRLIHR